MNDLEEWSVAGQAVIGCSREIKGKKQHLRETLVFVLARAVHWQEETEGAALCRSSVVPWRARQELSRSSQGAGWASQRDPLGPCESFGDL